jgi:hypothetical protein
MALEFRTIGTDLTPDESGFRFEGYAAVFNTESRGLDFTEVIQPGAFTRSLTAAQRGEWEVKAYQDHDPKMFLGSTRTGTLKLTEDKLGLKVDLSLNKDVSYARDLAANIRRDGAGAGMSFGFTTPRMGDSWSADGSKRELKSVKLHEVSVIVGGTPAYESTVGLASVRSVARTTKLDPEEVRLALSGLISGKLNPERAATVRAMLGALSVAPEPLPEPSDEPESLPLQIRKLQLMLAEFRHPGHGDQSVHAPKKGAGGGGGGADGMTPAMMEASRVAAGTRMDQVIGIAKQDGASKSDIASMTSHKDLALAAHKKGDGAAIGGLLISSVQKQKTATGSAKNAWDTIGYQINQLRIDVVGEG